YFCFNVEEEPFDNKDVRVALNHAVDKESLINAFYAGQGEPAKNPMPPTVDGYNDEIEAYEYASANNSFAFSGSYSYASMPPTVDGYNDEIEAYEYDPEKAKELLADAGYPDGFEMDLWTMSNPRPYLPEPGKIAENIQSTFGEVGVDVNIQTYE